MTLAKHTGFYPTEGGRVEGGRLGNDIQLWNGGGVKQGNAVYLITTPMNY